MMTGEYFLSQKAKDQEKRDKKREQKETRKTERAEERNLTLTAPKEDDDAPTKKYENRKPSSVEDLKSKFLKKK